MVVYMPLQYLRLITPEQLSLSRTIWKTEARENPLMSEIRSHCQRKTAILPRDALERKNLRDKSKIIGDNFTLKSDTIINTLDFIPTWTSFV